MIPADIIHVIDSLAPGGAERMVVELANATDRDRFRASVCVTRCDTRLAPLLDDDIELLVLGRQSARDILAWRKLTRRVRAAPRAVLQAHGRSSYQNIALLRELGLLPSKIAVVLHDHRGQAEVDPHFPSGLGRLLRRQQPIVVGVHPALTEAAQSVGVRPERTKTIRNAIALDAVRDRVERARLHGSSRREAGGSLRLGVVVANFKREKGLHVLIEALAWAECSNIEIVVVGSETDPGYSSACRRALVDMGVERLVRFAGSVSDVSDILARADFGVVPSLSESGPLVLLEYGAIALPVVATTAGLIGQDLAARGVPGFVEPGNPRALAAAIDVLLREPAGTSRDRGEMLRAAVRAGYDVKCVMSDWYEVYGMALAS